MSQTARLQEQQDHLHRFNTLLEAIEKRVREKRLLLPHPLEWDLPEDQATRPITRWLRNLYRSSLPPLRQIVPGRFLLAFALLISFAVTEAFAAALWAYMPRGGLPPTSAMNNVLRVGVLSLAFLALLYSAIGAYWTLWLIAVNRCIRRPFRALILGCVILAVVVWLLLGARPFPLTVEGAAQSLIGQNLVTTRQDTGFRVFTAVFLYIPGLSLVAIWTSAVYGQLVFWLLTAAWWLLKIHVVEPIEGLSEFLIEPLELDADQPQTMMQMDDHAIEALAHWVACRREVIQGRIIPTTLLIAALGLFANTDWGNRAVLFIEGALRNMGAPAEGWLYFVDYGKYMFVLALFMFPVIILGSLLTDAYVMDTIAQLCALHKQTRQAPREQSAMTWAERLE